MNGSVSRVVDMLAGRHLQDSQVFETREVRLGDNGQVVSIQVTERQTRQKNVRGERPGH